MIGGHWSRRTYKSKWMPISGLLEKGLSLTLRLLTGGLGSQHSPKMRVGLI